MKGRVLMTNTNKKPVLVLKETLVTRFYPVSMNELDKILGDAQGLIIGINSCHGLESVNVYRFSRSFLAKNAKVRAILFGRENAKGHFIGSEAVANYLAKYYDSSKFVIATTSVTKLDELPTTDKGRGLEYLLTHTHKFNETTPEEDKIHKQDVKKGKNTYQVKCSTASNKTNWSYSITNNSVVEL